MTISSSSTAHSMTHSTVLMNVSARKFLDSDFYSALKILRDESGGNADTGFRFERLIRRALESHPYEYGEERFEKVWLWSDWPERKALGYGTDIGIDIVAQQTPAYGGGLCAVQCKNYAEDRKVPTKSVDSFLAASGSRHFTHRILVVTSDLHQTGWTKVEKASPECKVLGPTQLSSWEVTWCDHIDKPESLHFETAEKYTPRPHQREALDAITKGYSQHSKGRVIMPCGTGKSLVGMWAAEENVGRSGTVLYLVPSIALMGQTMREWSRHRKISHAYLGVCSDRTTGRKATDQDSARDMAELTMPVSTDKDKIARKLSSPVGGEMRVVFCTYQSLPTLAEAIKTVKGGSTLSAAPNTTPSMGNFTFDMVICDEAHRTTGVDKPTRGEMSAFRLIHDDEAVPAKFKMFMTATQRVYTASAKVSAAHKDSDVFSMDDAEIYGPLLYEMSFKEAVDTGLLSDYEVLIVATSQSRATQRMDEITASVNNAHGKKSIISKDDAVRLLGCWDALADPNTAGIAKNRPTGKLAPRNLTSNSTTSNSTTSSSATTDDATNTQPGSATTASTYPSSRGHLKTAIAFSNTVKFSQAIAGASREEHGVWQSVAYESAVASTNVDAADVIDPAEVTDIAEVGDATKVTEGGDAADLVNAAKVVDRADLLNMTVEHIDGTTPAIARATILNKLRNKPQHGTCQVISNARVLTEGVDLPALDAVIFMQPRKSKIDIVQAVGRVMRTYPGKTTGYVVIPVLVPEGQGVTDAEVLNSSEFNIVWDVVSALRSHDERMDLWVNHVDAARSSERFKLIDRETDQPMEDDDNRVEQLRFMLDEKIASKIVEQCGDRKTWPSWGVRAARVCREVRKKMDTELAKPSSEQAFEEFVNALRSVVGDHLTANQAAEMVSQHVVTIPIFNCLFADSQFAHTNPISTAINNLLSHFHTPNQHSHADNGTIQHSHANNGSHIAFASHAEHANLDATTSSHINIASASLATEMFAEELRPLTRAYHTMRTVFQGALTASAKVDVLRDIYNGFFHVAMKDVVSRLGIVYTPVEIVDFIVRSADAVCRAEFGSGLTAENVHILDPFTGTGTFIYQMLTLQNVQGEDIIHTDDLQRKYYSELHANEVVLLAYYIAAIKIEAGMAERGGFPNQSFHPFPGITFGDTFISNATNISLPGMSDNSERARFQGGLSIRVVVGNPPWSAGQKSAGDDNPNVVYSDLAGRVRDTYGCRHREVTGRSGGGNSAGNLYVQSLRWASDRLNNPDGDSDGVDGDGGGVDVGGDAGCIEPGVVAMVHPNSLLNATSLAGMRACLRDEFTGIYVVNLLGDAMKSGEEGRREGQPLFGQGSRSGVQITVLVRNPGRDLSEPAVLRYVAVPEYSSVDEKFEWLQALGDVTSNSLEVVPVNEEHHWVNLTDGTFNNLLPVCENKTTTKHNNENETGGVLVTEHASGVKTNCDVYVYSFSREQLREKILRLIDAYNRAREQRAGGVKFSDVTRNDNLAAIKWTATLKHSLKQGLDITYDESRIREVLYRPFTKLWLYEDNRILSSIRTISKMFPQTNQITPPPKRSTRDLYHSTIKQNSLRNARDKHYMRSLSNRNEPANTMLPTQNLNHTTAQKLAICITTPTNRTVFGTLATGYLPDLHTLDPATRTLTQQQT